MNTPADTISQKCIPLKKCLVHIKTGLFLQITYKSILYFVLDYYIKTRNSYPVINTALVATINYNSKL